MSVSQMNGLVFANQILHFWVLYQYSITQKIRTKLLIDFKTSLYESPIWWEDIQKVSRFASFSQENGFLVVNKNFIFQPCSNVQSLKRFDLSFCKISKQIYRKFQCREISLEKFQGLPHFSRKVVLYLPTKFAFLSLVPIINHSEDSIYFFGRFYDKVLGNSNMEEDILRELSRFALFF